MLFIFTHVRPCWIFSIGCEQRIMASKWVVPPRSRSGCPRALELDLVRKWPNPWTIFILMGDLKSCAFLTIICVFCIAPASLAPA
jgi:hypothetical protein